MRITHVFPKAMGSRISRGGRRRKFCFARSFIRLELHNVLARHDARHARNVPATAA